MIVSTINAVPSDTIPFLNEALAAAAAIGAAERLGVLDRLQAATADAAAVARECAISERGATLLLAALAGLGVVDATHGGYQPSEQFDRLRTLSALYRQIDEAVRDGGTALATDRTADAEIFYPDVVPLLRAIFAPAAERVADYLTASARGPFHSVLDLGAGTAPWSQALARRDSSCRVTAVDLPGVVTGTRQAVALAGCSEQFSFVSGDLLTLDWSPGGYDLVIVGNLCHLFEADVNQRLLNRLWSALKPHGTLAIVDAVRDDGRDGPRPVVLYALSLLVRTQAGRVYPFSTYVGWLRDAGLADVERFELSATPALTLITAGRPG